MFESFENVLDAFFICVLIASVIAWIWLAQTRIAKRLPLVEPEGRRRPFWTFAEFFVCFGLFIVCTGAAQSFGQRWMSPETTERLEAGTFSMAELPASDMTRIILMSSLASALAMTSVMVWMNFTNVRQLKLYGILPNWDDVKLGAKTSFLVLPPVLLISTVIDSLIKYEHPVLDTIGLEPTGWSLFMLAVTTILWTPMFEEFTFRVLLQGGAEQFTRRLAANAQKEPPVPQRDVDYINPEEVTTWSWWPVVMSSGTFAVLHLGQGGAAVPLFFLAIALGYLYRQTGRLGPSLVVHLALNAFTMIVATMNMFLGEK